MSLPDAGLRFVLFEILRDLDDPMPLRLLFRSLESTVCFDFTRGPVIASLLPY